MGDKSGIEWTDATWNPVSGCNKVSHGCKNCYAERVFPRVYGRDFVQRVAAHGATGELCDSPRRFTDVWMHENRLDMPLRWKRPRRIFVNSMSDLFHQDVLEPFIDKVIAVMALCPQHTFQVLTKRPARMLDYLSQPDMIEGLRSCLRIYDQPGNTDLAWPLPNVWLGVSVEDQATADERIPLLLQTPAAVRWLSCEPLLGPVDLTSIEWPNKCGHRVDALRAGYWDSVGWQGGGPSAALGSPRGGFTNHSDMERVDWVVVGGESGPGARPMHPAWARSLRDQCVAAGVPFFFKQWGEWSPVKPADLHKVTARRYSHDSITFRPDGSRYKSTEPDTLLKPDMVSMYRVGKKEAGRLLGGHEWNEYPGAA